jgi:hypothetical protein
MSTTELEMYGLLVDVSEFLADQMDVVDGSYGVPQPNRAMNLYGRVEELLNRLEQAIKEKS